ncbi:hypothetical protein H4R34_001302 [Dimargaris verticillata]|uniref:Ubiquitin-like domain-containing protein n=1 Tax=Dimargaris verticillata TaxID=2761393 RepID=A0A9W8EEL3_9FUNG|nr:hypothetical protein H4R34_001302 [Dimargaris verticillata]
MGGCFSSPEGPASPPGRSPASVLAGTESQNRTRMLLTRSGNKPLVSKRHYVWKSDRTPPITHSQLEQDRQAFWDTAPEYEGKREIWQALHSVCQASSKADAQAIVDSAQITVPTGRLCDGCYDALGNRYVVPLYCLADPTNLAPDETVLAASSVTKEGLINDGLASASDDRTLRPAEVLNAPQMGTTPGSDTMASDLSLRKQEKSSVITQSPHSPSLPPLSSSAVSPESHPNSALKSVTIRLNTGKDIKVTLSPESTMQDVRDQVCQAENLKPSRTTIRFFHLGKTVDESTKPLVDLKLPRAKIIQAMIVPRR